MCWPCCSVPMQPPAPAPVQPLDRNQSLQRIHLQMGERVFKEICESNLRTMRKIDAYDVQSVRKYIQAGGDCNKEYGRWTPLMGILFLMKERVHPTSDEWRNLHEIAMAIIPTIDVNKRVGDGADESCNGNAVEFAFLYPIEIIMSAVVNRGADLQHVYSGTNGKHPFQYVCEGHWQQTAVAIINQTPDISNLLNLRIGAKRQHPFRYACKKALEQIAIAIINRTTDLTNIGGVNPLKHAFKLGLRGVANAAIEKGADLSVVRKKCGATPLLSACKLFWDDTIAKIVHKTLNQEWPKIITVMKASLPDTVISIIRNYWSCIVIDSPPDNNGWTAIGYLKAQREHNRERVDACLRPLFRSVVQIQTNK